MTSSRVLRFPAASSSRLCSAHSRDKEYGTAEQNSYLAGKSPAIGKLWGQLHRVAPYFRAALLVGEPGTGAEIAAAALHQGSPYRDQPLRTLSAPAAEAYFVRGHFAAGSILFLENIEALSAKGQGGLLRLLQMRGPRQACVIAASHTDLRSVVGGGGFSPELATRLGGLRIALPALRERREDIPEVLRKAAGNLLCDTRHSAPLWDTSFLDAACGHTWPRNLLDVQAILAWLQEHRAATPWTNTDFADAVSACAGAHEKKATPARMVRLDEVLQQHIRAVLSACFGNKQKAAEVLGISRSTLYRMLDAGASCLIQKAG